MTKQERIKEELEQMQFMPDELEVFEGTQTWSIRPSGVRKILNKLHDNDVVIKVEKELPRNFPTDAGHAFEKFVQNDMLKDSYVATEPLKRS